MVRIVFIDPVTRRIYRPNKILFFFTKLACKRVVKLNNYVYQQTRKRLNIIELFLGEIGRDCSMNAVYILEITVRSNC